MTQKVKVRVWHGILHAICAMTMFTLGQAASASPLKPFAPSDAEIRLLPPFCQAKLGKGGADIWVSRFGADNWLHMHHYCYALNFMNRARFEMDPNYRKHYLGSAINNFDYVLQRWKPGFPLYGNARSLKMQAERMRGQ